MTSGALSARTGPPYSRGEKALSIESTAFDGTLHDMPMTLSEQGETA